MGCIEIAKTCSMPSGGDGGLLNDSCLFKVVFIKQVDAVLGALLALDR